MKKRILAMVLACLMTVSMLGLAVSAQGAKLTAPAYENSMSGVSGGASAYSLQPLPEEDLLYFEEAEPNNNFTDADWVSRYSVMYGDLHDANDQDFFVVNMTEPGLLDTSITANSPDLRYVLWDYYDNMIGFTSESYDVGGGKYQSYLSYYLPEAGMYYLQVYDRRTVSNAPVEYHIDVAARPFVNRYDDVLPDKYYYFPVQWADCKDIIGGIAPNQFGPDLPCTRAQMVSFLWRYEGCPVVVGTTNPFVDVNPGDYYYNAVMWALQRGITSGVEENRFGAYDSCTRAQMVTLLWNYCGKVAADRTVDFVDVFPGAYYYKAIQWAVEYGITSGVDSTHFDPNGLCTRGQAVTFLIRLP